MTDERLDPLPRGSRSSRGFRCAAITKRFPGVLADDAGRLRGDSAGEVHALLGENGAGKTTLSHILTGLYRPDSGEIRHQRPGLSPSPRLGRRSTPACAWFIKQFRLVERFTVAENIVLGDTRGVRPPTCWSTRQAVEGEVRSLGERYGLPVDPHAHIFGSSQS